MTCNLSYEQSICQDSEKRRIHQETKFNKKDYDVGLIMTEK